MIASLKPELAGCWAAQSRLVGIMRFTDSYGRKEQITERSAKVQVEFNGMTDLGVFLKALLSSDLDPASILHLHGSNSQRNDPTHREHRSPVVNIGQW